MTYAQLEAVFRANEGVSYQAALDAVYSQGYYDGAGLTVGPPIAKTRPAPTAVVKAVKPD